MATKATDIDTAGPGAPLTGAKVLLILVLCFGAVFAVNGLMVYYAETTFSGEVDPHPYTHGIHYNRQIAAAKAQYARDWHVVAHIGRATRGLTPVEAIFRDRNNSPLRKLDVVAKLNFATNMARDRTTTLKETAPGVYRGSLAVESGQWDLILDAKRGGKRLFLSRNRVTIP